MYIAFIRYLHKFRKGPSIKYLRNLTCYLDPPPLFFACNTQWKCIRDFTPLGAYLLSGRSLIVFFIIIIIKFGVNHHN